MWPFYDGREARFRLELVHSLRQAGVEDVLLLAALGELGEVDEEEWDTEEFEHEKEE